MAEATEIHIIKPYPAQARILEQAKRNNLLILSRRYGKTTLGHYMVIKRVLKAPKTRVAWSSPTWKLMMQGWEDLTQILKPAISRMSREDRRIELVNDSLIEMWSTDDPQAGRGRKYHSWIHDEAQRDRNLVKFIRGSARPTLADYRGDLWVLGTANGEGSQLHDFYLECLEDKHWFVAHGKLEDNPYIDPEEIAIMRRDLGPELAAQELDSQWVRVDGITPLVRRSHWESLYGEVDNKIWTRALAIDASISGDLTGVIGVWLDPVTGFTYIDYGDITLFEPDTTTGEINYIALENSLWERWRTGRYHVLTYDPYQMVSLAQRLKARGVRTFEFTQNSMRLKADGYLRQLINDSKLRHPDHALLTEHILNATIKYTNNAFRLIKGTKNDKIDLAVALSMACWTLNVTRTQATQPFTASVALPRPQTQLPTAQFAGPGANTELLGRLLSESPWGKRT